MSKEAIFVLIHDESCFDLDEKESSPAESNGKLSSVLAFIVIGSKCYNARFFHVNKRFLIHFPSHDDLLR